MCALGVLKTGIIYPDIKTRKTGDEGVRESSLAYWSLAVLRRLVFGCAYEENEFFCFFGKKVNNDNENRRAWLPSTKNTTAHTSHQLDIYRFSANNKLPKNFFFSAFIPSHTAASCFLDYLKANENPQTGWFKTGCGNSVWKPDRKLAWQTQR